MTPNADEQKQAQEEKQRATLAGSFRFRWLKTLFVALIIAMELSFVLSTASLRQSQFPYFNFAASFHNPTTFTRLIAILFLAGILVWTWLDVAKYRRDEKKQAQERALADAGRQMENVWPPAPTKLE